MASLSTLITSTRRLLNLVNDTTAITDAEITAWLNEGIRRLCVILEYPRLSNSSITVSTGTALYTTTAGFMNITDIYLNNSKLTVVDEDFMSSLKINWRGDGNGTPKYVLIDDATSGSYTLRLHQPPDANSNGQTLLIVGIAFPTDLSASTDVPDLPTGFHDIIPFWACSQANLKRQDLIKAKFFKDMFEDGYKRLSPANVEAEELKQWRFVPE